MKPIAFDSTENQPHVVPKIRLYVDYLEDLHRLCDAKGLGFKTVDRVLYQFDKVKERKAKKESDLPRSKEALAETPPTNINVVHL